MTEGIPDFTPVTLLTGFLGSGKTTLLNRILADPAFADTAVIINEFGDVGLDHHLIESVMDDVVLMASGCLCCVLKGELAASLRDLHSRRARGLLPPFQRVVIESTGLADPYPVISTLKADPVLRHHFRFASVITTVDAFNGAETLARYGEAVRQVAIADTLILTKTDLTVPERIQGLRDRLSALSPVAPIRVTSDLDLDLGALLDRGDNGGGWFKATVDVGEDRRPTSGSHRTDITSFSIRIDDPLDWTAFGLWLTMLINRHGDRLLRVKGILSLIGEQTPVAVHGVQHLVHPPQHLPSWPDDDHGSRLVFIVDGLDPDLLRRSLKAFLSLEPIR